MMLVRRIVPLLFCGVLLASAPRANARRNGFASDSCEGCHRGGQKPMVSITADPVMLDPGGSTTLTLHIQQVNGPVAGFYLTSNQKGVFAEIAGQGARKVSDFEMTHSAPKQGNGTEVTFQMRWTAPAATGGIDFDLVAVSANGSGNSGGDGEGRTRFGISVGCDGPGVNVYSDNDGDGFGVT